MAAKKERQGKGSVRFFIDLLLDEDILKLYKHFSGVTQVRFKDRADAEIRLLNICSGKMMATMMAAFKVVGVDEATSSQYGGALRGPIAAPEGRLLDKPEALKKHAKVLTVAAERKSPRLRDLSASVLLALREAIPADAKGEAATISSTVLAEKMSTNVNAVCRAAEQLKKQNLIELEDDSQLEHQFYWLSLTQAGRDLDVQPPSVKLPAATPGPRTSFSGQRIFRLTKENPRRVNTCGWKSFNLIRDGMTYEEYKKAGGRNNDLQWDIDKKFVELRSEGQEPSAPVAAVASTEAGTKKTAKTKAAKTKTTKKAPPAKKKAKAAAGGK